MHIAIIGGLDRNAPDLAAVAEARGHTLEAHTGVIGGAAAAASLRALVARADIIFLITDLNSHNAVQIARRTARVHHLPARIVRRLGPTHLASYLTLLAVETPTLRYAAG
jgi:hypothetical protein